MKTMVEPRVLEMMGLVVSWTLEQEGVSEAVLLTTDCIHSRIADLMFSSRMWMNWQSLYHQDAIGSWHLSAASFFHLRTFSSFWTLFENSKSYQKLWNREVKNSLFTEQNFHRMKHLGTESGEGEPALMEAVHTVLRFIVFPNRLHCTMQLFTSYMKTVFCSQSYLSNARDKLPFQEVLSRAESRILNS